jgi:hypothetical protein
MDIPNMQSVTYTISFIWHPQDWTGADISNILGYQTVPIFCRQLSKSVNLSLIFISPQKTYIFKLSQAQSLVFFWEALL